MDAEAFEAHDNIRLSGHAMNTAVPVPFGFPEFWEQFRAKFGPVLKVLSGHQAALNGIVNQAYESLDGWQRCVLNLGSLTGVGMTELVTLAGNGCGHGAMKILRSMLENAIDAEFLRLDPARFDDYLEWDDYERWRVYKAMLKVNPAARDVLGLAELARAKTEYERVRSRFRCNGQKRARWCTANLESEAKQAHLTGLYEMIHPLATRMLHGGMFALVLHFDPKSDPHRIDVPPAMAWCQQALVGGECCLRQAIGTLAQALNVEPTPGVQELAEQIRAEWADLAASGTAA